MRTVGELVAYLQELDPNEEVVLTDDDIHPGAPDAIVLEHVLRIEPEGPNEARDLGPQ